MGWVVLWCLCGIAGGVMATYYDFNRDGELTVADIFYTVVFGCVGGILVLICALVYTGGFVIYRKKSLTIPKFVLKW